MNNDEFYAGYYQQAQEEKKQLEEQKTEGIYDK